MLTISKLIRVWGSPLLMRNLFDIFVSFQAADKNCFRCQGIIGENHKVQPAAAMEQKRLRINSPNGDQKILTVADTTTFREISLELQCHEGGAQDCEASLLRGVTLLEPDMTVSQAGLGDGDDIFLVWSDPFVEMASWTGEKIGKDLYVRIPPGTTSIDDRAFQNCKALVKVLIPNSVTSIGNLAFAGCSSLKQVEIPNSVTHIGRQALSGCSSLTQVKIPNSVTSIRQGTFLRCSSLTQVEIPDSVTSIRPQTFAGCSSLAQVEIPHSVTSLDEFVFLECSSLKQLCIPNSVTRIGEAAFRSCSSLTEVNIPDSVTSIGFQAFSGCSSLKQVEIPDSLSSIGQGAFDCSISRRK